MISKFTLTAMLLAFVTMASAQSTSQRGRDLFKGKTLPAKERGLDTRENLRTYLEAMQKHHISKHILAKSASSFTARLDSAVSEESIKVNFAYDANGNCTLELFSFWEGFGMWFPFEKIESTYNEDNLVIEVINSYADEDGEQLMPFHRETYTYTDEGLLDELTSYFREGSEWLAMTLVSYAYDDQGNIFELTISFYDEMTESFDVFGLQTYTYNATGGLTEILTSGWNGADWENSSRLTFTLNDDNLVLQEEFSFWLMGDESWQVFTSNTYTYNAAGLEAEVIYSIYDAVEEALIPEAKNVRTYDSMDRLASEEFFFWNIMESNWINLYLDQYEYDLAGNLAVAIYQYWDEDAAEYVIEGIEVSTFNNDYPSENIMAPEWYREFANHMILNSTYTDVSMGEEFEESIDFFYTLFDVVSVKEASQNAFSVYPNPFRETIRFAGAEEMQRFTLYDLQGRVLLQKQLAGAREVYPDHLPAGMYVYQLDGVNTRQTGKLVKE